jgi:hypothetical protein
LPIEIREKIIRILLSPVLRRYHDGRTVVEYTEFTVKSLVDPCEDQFLDYGDEFTYAASEIEGHRSYKAMLFPGRVELYDLTLFPRRQISQQEWLLDLLFLRWLRQASYVSNTFRYELGQILWSKVKLCAKNEFEWIDKDGDSSKSYKNRALNGLWNLLDERPATHRGVDTLSISLQIARGQFFPPLYFNCWCKYIAKTLDLREVTFKIWAAESALKKLVESKPCCLDGLVASEKLRVSKFFDVELERVCHQLDREDWDMDSNSGDTSDDDSVWGSDDELDKYRKPLREYMYPLTLADNPNKEPETEEERYLQTRAAEFGETEEPNEDEEIEASQDNEEAQDIEQA